MWGDRKLKHLIGWLGSEESQHNTILVVVIKWVNILVHVDERVGFIDCLFLYS